MKNRKLTEMQVQILTNLAGNLPASAGLHMPTRSHHGGYSASLMALAKRGLVLHAKQGFIITEAGRQRLAEFKKGGEQDG